jgi:hypothetical protein
MYCTHRPAVEEILWGRYSRLIEHTRKFLAFWATKSGGSMIWEQRAIWAEAPWVGAGRAGVWRWAFAARSTSRWAKLVIDSIVSAASTIKLLASNRALCHAGASNRFSRPRARSSRPAWRHWPQVGPGSLIKMQFICPAIYLARHERWLESPYCRLFCGEEFFWRRPPS